MRASAHENMMYYFGSVGGGGVGCVGDVAVRILCVLCVCVARVAVFTRAPSAGFLIIVFGAITVSDNQLVLASGGPARTTR